MSSPVNSRVTLSALPKLAVVRVIDVTAEGGDASRLKALGICAGRQLQLVQAGDPLIVRVLGTRVGLSARLAEAVSVELVDAKNPTSPACSNL